jgi:Tol biopolymer transport system component/serine/threonine protein kinase
MTPERWQQVNKLFHSALKREPTLRAAFLNQACHGDEELLKEVESLIESHEQTDSFIDEPPIEAAAQVLSANRIDLEPGQLVGHYKIVSLLGSGGMGDVYLAQDSRLGRKLALKMLPAEFIKDADRVRRFEQEARAASALTHPNILTIFGIEEAEGKRFIATEYIEGKTLRACIADGKLELGESLNLAYQIASALAAAHKAGIVHRDIKPENIMLRPDGYVKVLDFGLAKLTERGMDGAEEEPRAFANVKTDAGVRIGTVSYMSPEQAREQPVDQRSDVFNVGVVLYEMLTGQMAFRRDSAFDTMQAIVHDEPAGLSELKSRIPTGVDRVLRRCLAKNPEGRYSDGSELTAALKELMTSSGANAGVLAHSQGFWLRWRRSSLITLAAIGVVLCAIIVGRVLQSAIKGYSRSASEAPLPPMEVRPFTSFAGSEWMGSFSPDGTQIAFAWTGEKEGNFAADIYVKQIGVEKPLRLTFDPAQEVCPVWSPDGQRIAFIRYSEDGAVAIWSVPILGGEEHRLLSLGQIPFPPRWDWSADGKWIAFRDMPPKDEPCRIVLVSPETGERHALTSPADNLGGSNGPGDSEPAFSPDGQDVAFIRRSSLVSGDIYIVHATGGEPRRVTFDNEDITTCGWTADGREIIFSSNPVGRNASSLWRISASGGVAEQIAVAGYDVISPHVSHQGNRLAYVQQSGEMNIYRVVVSDRGGFGPPTKLIASTRNDSAPQFSPDGRRITFQSDRSGANEIYICDSDGSNTVQVTALQKSASHPAWSPDGRQICFDFVQERRAHVFVVSADGSLPRAMTAGDFDDFNGSWSSDGKWIYFTSNRNGTYQIWKTPAQGGEDVQVTRQGGFSALESSDGKYVYYIKNPPSAGIWRISVDGGEDVQLLNSFMGFGNSAVVNDGIYFLRYDANDLLNMEFFNFAMGNTRQVARLAKFHVFDGTISSDRRQILYTQLDNEGHDIKLVENFR